MIALRDTWRVTARKLFAELGQLKLSPYSASKAYEREWVRRQREAVRRSIEADRQAADQ